jgi:hypothetical protein
MAQPTHRHDTAHRGLVPTGQLGSGVADVTKVLYGDQTWGTYSASADLGTIVVCFDGGGSVLTAKAQDVYLPASGTLLGWTLLADQADTLSVAVWASSYAGYPPVSGGSITGGNDPALAATADAQDSTLTGWTKPFALGTCLRFTLSPGAAATRVFLILTYTR